MSLCYYRHPGIPAERRGRSVCIHCQRWHSKQRAKKRPDPGATTRVDINQLAPYMNQSEFWGRVQHGEPDQCWPWKAGHLPKGYGLCSIGGASALAHRVAYILGHGPIPDGRIVRHKCDNPPCCNPAHLVIGTYADNEADKKRASSNGEAGD